MRRKKGSYEVNAGRYSENITVTPEEGGEGLPWALIGGIIVVVIAISAFALYKRK